MMRALLASLFVVVALSVTARAQPHAPPDVSWAFLGVDSVKVVAFTLVEPADGSPYTLPLASFYFPAPAYYPDTEYPHPYSSGFVRLVGSGPGHNVPPDSAWNLIAEYFRPFSLYADASGLVIEAGGDARYRLGQSTDGGFTWTDVESPGCDGDSIDRRISRTYGPGRERALWIVGDLCRSDDDGLTWAPVPQLSAPSYLRRRDLFEMPASAMLPEGRLLLGVGGGVILSEDNGSTWGASSLYQDFRWVAHKFGFHPDSGHPYGGTVYVIVGDYGATSADQIVVFASDDGGTTWALRHRFVVGEHGLDQIDGEPELVVLGDGSLVAGLLSSRAGPRGLDLGTIVWSGDGGVTWHPLGPQPPWLGSKPPDGVCNPACPEGAWPGWGAQHLRVDRDGRIWAGTENGVWRTTGPAWAVASEDEPSTPPASVGVSVWPNPTGGAVTVAVALTEPQAIRVSVVDALGREVAVVHEGASSDGQRLQVDTEGWPVGTYTVRVATEAGGASAGLIIAW